MDICNLSLSLFSEISNIKAVLQYIYGKKMYVF